MGSLAQRVKATREALRLAEQELEDAEAFAKKKVRLATRAEAEKTAEILRTKALAAKKGKAKVNLSMNVAKQRVDDLRAAVAVAQRKAFDATRKQAALQAGLEQAMQRFEKLKAEGEEVPDNLDEFRDISAPGSWKPPGILAAKAVVSAKAALAKALPIMEKADSVLLSSQQRLEAAESKLGAVRQKHKIAEERKHLADEALAGTSLPEKLKAKPAARVLKAILKKPASRVLSKKPTACSSAKKRPARR